MKKRFMVLAFTFILTAMQSANACPTIIRNQPGNPPNYYVFAYSARPAGKIMSGSFPKRTWFTHPLASGKTFAVPFKPDNVDLIFWVGFREYDAAGHLIGRSPIEPLITIWKWSSCYVNPNTGKSSILDVGVR